MGVEKIHIDQFLELSKQHPVIDVRSPGEYGHAHIPGAYSLPLFTDEERAIVGTTYKQKSREAAIKAGLAFFGPKMKKMVEEVESGVKSREPGVKPESNDSELQTKDSRLILLYCWRGGMRSAAVAWLMDLYGFKVYTLDGGYKKFRNYVLETFRLPFHFKILGGFTGSGKTETLKALKQKGERIIDLEEIAQHKGSAFGNIGMPEQPGQEMFENILAQELRRKSMVNSQCLPAGQAGSIENNKSSHSPPDSPDSYRDRDTTHHSPIWLEDESRRIGLVNIPPDLWSAMRRSPVYFLNIPFDERIRRLVQEYGNLDKQRMINAIDRIREKLGGLNAKNAVQLLQEGKISESFTILLQYYDKYYLKALHNREDLNSLLTTINCETVTPENAGFLTGPLQYQHENH